MALFLYRAILNNRPINVFNNGLLSRDFTYIDDIVLGVERTLLENSKNKNKYKIYNIGNGSPDKLLDFIETIEKYLGITSKKNLKPMQLGDVYKTFSDTNKLKEDYDYNPSTNIEQELVLLLIGLKIIINTKLVYENIKIAIIGLGYVGLPLEDYLQINFPLLALI